jgi:ABC-type nitrate/sulfonate/bicarbonate transport system substrate-binding protein
MSALTEFGGVGLESAVGNRAAMATAFRAMTHSMAWFGVEAGIFNKLGVNASFEKFTPGGPDIPLGLQRGEFEFGHTGMLPTAQTVLSGGDAVALLRNTSPHASTFLMTKREYTRLDQLDGKIVAVISDEFSGQSGVEARLTVEKSGADANYVGLGNFQDIYQALVAGEIDAGILQIHQRYPGQRQYGWNAFELVSLELPSVFISTRKLIATDRALVQQVVQGMVQTIHFFKTQHDAAVPLIQRFLQIDDRKAAIALHAFYAPLFPAVPRVDLGERGLKSLRANFSTQFPTAATLSESDLVDSSFIDQLDQSGFIRQLYGEAADMGELLAAKP